MPPSLFDTSLKRIPNSHRKYKPHKKLVTYCSINHSTSAKAEGALAPPPSLSYGAPLPPHPLKLSSNYNNANAFGCYCEHNLASNGCYCEHNLASNACLYVQSKSQNGHTKNPKSNGYEI